MRRPLINLMSKAEEYIQFIKDIILLYIMHVQGIYLFIYFCAHRLVNPHTKNTLHTHRHERFHAVTHRQAVHSTCAKKMGIHVYRIKNVTFEKQGSSCNFFFQTVLLSSDSNSQTGDIVDPITTCFWGTIMINNNLNQSYEYEM